ncbi:MAG TPA: hypothetical protein V6C57_06640 [Coleofasciculaceae cyanobacterium]
MDNQTKPRAIACIPIDFSMVGFADASVHCKDGGCTVPEKIRYAAWSAYDLRFIVKEEACTTDIKGVWVAIAECKAIQLCRELFHTEPLYIYSDSENAISIIQAIHPGWVTPLKHIRREFNAVANALAKSAPTGKGYIRFNDTKPSRFWLDWIYEESNA